MDAAHIQRAAAIIAQIRHVLASGQASDAALDGLADAVAALADDVMVAALQQRRQAPWVRCDDVRVCRECGQMPTEGHLLRCSLRQVRRQRRRGGAGPQRVCRHCGQPYTPTSGRQRQCEDCGRLPRSKRHTREVQSNGEIGSAVHGGHE